MDHRRLPSTGVLLKSSRTTLAGLVVVVLTLVLVGQATAAPTAPSAAPAAPAVVTPESNALTIAQAIASPSVNVTGASFAATTGGTPNGVSTSTLTGFPTNGPSFGILTSGNVSSVDQPGTQATHSNSGGTVRGDTDLDVQILKIDVLIPASGVNCMSFDFRFLSEEYPVYVGGVFNDAFIAELDSSTWTTAGSAITAPDNFAFDAANEVVSINSTGIGGMSDANGAGTAFDGDLTGPDFFGGATVLLSASTAITAGAHSLYLSIFDQGDRELDSAVFLDNLRTGFAENPEEECQPGAIEPSRLTLTKTVVNDGGGTAEATEWTLSATGPTSISGETGDDSVTDATVSPGTYTLAESGPDGYTAGAWQCTGGSLNGSSLTIADAETASCSITNTFSGLPPNQRGFYYSILLDRSASMKKNRTQTIDLYNEWLGYLQAGTPEDMATLAVFNKCNGYNRRGPASRPVSDLPPLTKSTYKTKCKTPLYDAVARTIKRANKNPLSKTSNVVIVIFTDGKDNASRRSRKKVSKMIGKKVDKGWSFIWFGDSIDPLVVKWADRAN